MFWKVGIYSRFYLPYSHDKELIQLIVIYPLYTANQRLNNCQMIVERMHAIAFVTPSFQRMRSKTKTKTNRTVHARFFPRFERVTSNCYEFDWFISLFILLVSYPVNSTTHRLYRLRGIKQPMKYGCPASLARVHVFCLLSHPSQKFFSQSIFCTIEARNASYPTIIHVHPGSKRVEYSCHAHFDVLL